MGEESEAMADGGTADPVRLPGNESINQANKERFVFRRDPAGDDVLPFEFTCGPGGGVRIRHMHMHQSEVFRGVSGQLTVLLDGEERTLGPGDVIEIPAGAAHGFVNDGDVDAVCDVEYRPAGRNEAWLKLTNAIERVHGRPPGMLEIAPFALDVGMYIAGPPIWTQRVLFGALKWVALALGKERVGLEAMERVYGEPFEWNKEVER
jgi:quercetin dioxygenase-like cupin family protein